jgi:hypothetical protein
MFVTFCQNMFNAKELKQVQHYLRKIEIFIDGIVLCKAKQNKSFNLIRSSIFFKPSLYLPCKTSQRFVKILIFSLKC